MSGLLPLSNDIIALRITCDARKPMIFCQLVRISAEIQTIMPACALFPVSSSVALRKPALYHYLYKKQRDKHN